MKHAKFVLPAALVVLAASTLAAQVITAPPLSGNFALTFSGFELITPSGSTSLHLDIKGQGLLTADGKGNLTGNADFQAANPNLPESGTVAALCAGGLTGTSTEPGDGTAQLVLQFTPSGAAPAGVGAQDACIAMAMSLNCVEVLHNPFPILDPLDNGLVSGVLPEKKHLKHKPHQTGTAGAPTGPDGTPVIEFPVLASGAHELKCIAGAVTTTSTAATIDGASLSFDLQGTAPASILVPSPIPEPSPLPPTPEGGGDNGGSPEPMPMRR